MATDSFERKVLGRVWEPVKDNERWRIRYNVELYKLYKEPCLSNVKLGRTW